MNRGRIVFILYKPAVPGNIGAAARAMKTMGFSQLRLVDPCDHREKEALMMAHGSRDILENAQVYSDADSALSDLDFVVGTTAKNRNARVDYLTARELPQLLEKKKDTIHATGILFGTEESGLPNTLLARCQAAVSIPMAAAYPSLNLGQAVMVMAYELGYREQTPGKHPGSTPGKQPDSNPSFPGTSSRQPSGPDPAASGTYWKTLDRRTREILEKAGIPAGTPLHNRIMERVSLMDQNDGNLLHSVTDRLLKKLR